MYLWKQEVKHLALPKICKILKVSLLVLSPNVLLLLLDLIFLIFVFIDDVALIYRVLADMVICLEFL